MAHILDDRMNRQPKILVFDSGLGGLTVFSEFLRLRPDADYIYCADDAGFPYGSWKEKELVERILLVLKGAIADQKPDMIVIACNTASTLALPHLRQAWPNIPFIGTVPAIKPAAQQSISGMITVLATPGTVKRDYTQNLIMQFAAHCQVTLIGSQQLAQLAENFMHQGQLDDDQIAAEIAPCFIEQDYHRTDTIVLACTHYPLLENAFRRLAPWPVTWIDPAPAIARHANQLIAQRFPNHQDSLPTKFGRAIFTSGKSQEATLRATLARYRLTLA